MISQSAPELKFLPQPTSRKHDYSPIVKADRVRLKTPGNPSPKSAGVKHVADGYRYSKNQTGGWTITLDPQIFFSEAETCFHRPHRLIDWEAPRPRATTSIAPISTSRCSSGHSIKYGKRHSSPTPKFKVPSMESTKVVSIEGTKVVSMEGAKVVSVEGTKVVQDSGRMEKELLFMQQRFDAQKLDFKATLIKLKASHKEKLATLEKEHNREVLLLENTHSELTQTMHADHERQVTLLEEKYEAQITEKESEVSGLLTKIRKMEYDHQTDLNDQFLKMEKSHEQKLEEYKNILHNQFETDFDERLAVRSNEIVGVYKKELLDVQQRHKEEILLLRRKFTKPSALIDELEICQKQISTMTEEVKYLRDKLRETKEELRQSQVEVASLNEQLKKHQLHHNESVRKVEQSFKDRLDMAHSENACLRLQAVKCQNKLGELKVSELMRNRSVRLDIRELLIKEKRKKQEKACRTENDVHSEQQHM